MKIYYFLCVLIISSLMGCATPNTMLVNPSNGEMRNCAASGWGWAGAPMAQMSHNSCVESLKSVGFVPATDVIPSVLKIESYPSTAKLYAGQSKETLKLIGNTPFSMTHPPGGRLWNKECYQVKKDGFEDSTVECYDQVWGDRYVSFKLKEKS